MFFALFSHSLSWWGHSHKLVAQIAASKLSRYQINKIERLIQISAYPRSTMVETSTWQDDLKADKLYSMASWHFSDKPIIKNKTMPIYPIPNTYNITTYLDSAWKTMNNPTTTDPYIWSFHLRNFIHFFGDMHTPHHNTMYYSEDYPTGDLGGNLWLLNCSFGALCKNMHSFWDSAGAAYPLWDPLVPEYKDEFYKNVSWLLKNRPESRYSDKDLKTFDPFAWNNESFDVAYAHGYSVPANSTPPQSYFEEVQNIARDRIAIAGYRLGNILIHLTSLDNMPVISHAYQRTIALWVVDSVLIVVSIVCLILICIDCCLKPKSDENQNDTLQP